MSDISTILVANRGEIAVRIIRTARSLGHRSIAVYSEVDATAPHVHLADDAVLLGPAPASESYLDPELILKAAAEGGADAIHPGYGFLSENAAFAEMVEAAGLVFIGPTAESIRLMGNKAVAKRLMLETGVPCIPGYQGEEQSDETLISAANDIGYPIMVKAAAGGGGKGMRLVHDPSEFTSALRAARSESLNAFGSDQLILEKAIIKPRHVEFQVFADCQGNVIHLGERDCSVQRRHQKIIEEAPCPVMREELRTRMGAAAVEAARSINYRGAGTVEFLLDQEGKFYFLEMNTRLQVEHPVTELITGLDLVAMQIRVAEGKSLGVSQEEVRLSGHAIEARLYAEDPAQDFLPVSGKIALWQPASNEGVRIDAGIDTGVEISPYYDPMIAKVIAWGENRVTANNRLIEALKRTLLFGLTTNKSFLIDILEKDRFRHGEANTAFIEEEFPDCIASDNDFRLEDAAIAGVLQFVAERNQAQRYSLACADELLNWASCAAQETRYRYRNNDGNIDLAVRPNGLSDYLVTGENEVFEIAVIPGNKLRNSQFTRSAATLVINGHRQIVDFLHEGPHSIYLARDQRTLFLRNSLADAGRRDEQGVCGRITAPMHGVMIEVLAEPGQRVSEGTTLAVMEAMKMQIELKSEVDGKVVEVTVAADDQVAADELLIEIEPDD
jgi:geranyl-CoA carboxylase alpha subunit